MNFYFSKIKEAKKRIFPFEGSLISVNNLGEDDKFNFNKRNKQNLFT